MSAASGEDYLVSDSAALLGTVEAPAEAPRAQWPFVIVAVVALAGIVLIAFDSLQQGLLGLALALALAAVMRLVLPARTAGWLASRTRMVDVGLLAALGASLCAVTLLLFP
jgi:hypothetical protein